MILSENGNMGVTILHQKLRIATIPKDSIHLYTHFLIKIAFLNNSRNKFFSFTRTDDEYSIVVDQDNYKDLEAAYNDGTNSKRLTETGDIWLALQMSVDDYAPISLAPSNDAAENDHCVTSSAAGGISKIARTLIIPLADCHISVYCISSYQTDYILVKVDDLQTVIECMKSRSCSIYRDEADGETVTVYEPSSPSPPGGRCAASTTAHHRPDRSIRHHLHFPTNKFYMASMTSDMLARDSALNLISNMFYSQSHQQQLSPLRSTSQHDGINDGIMDGADESDITSFFSFSLVGDEISLVLDEHTLQRFPPRSILFDMEAFKMIKIGANPLGFDECGIVAQISEPIAEANISEYYVSTFFFDHTFVPEEVYDQVLSLLKSKQE